MRTIDLLAYASRCGINLEGAPVGQPGVCPVCGGKLGYQEPDSRGYYVLNWRCLDCGATGKECYRKTFDGHYDVRDAGGDLVDRRKPKE